MQLKELDPALLVECCTLVKVTSRWRVWGWLQRLKHFRNVDPAVVHCCSRDGREVRVISVLVYARASVGCLGSLSNGRFKHVKYLTVGSTWRIIAVVRPKCTTGGLG